MKGWRMGETVDLRAEFEESGVRAVLEELNAELVGLAPVKARIRETAALLLVDRARRHLGLATGAPTLHMSFTGNPGHRQDDSGAEDGGVAASAGLCPQGASGQRHA